MFDRLRRQKPSTRTPQAPRRPTPLLVLQSATGSTPHLEVHAATDGVRIRFSGEDVTVGWDALVDRALIRALRRQFPDRDEPARSEGMHLRLFVPGTLTGPDQQRAGVFAEDHLDGTVRFGIERRRDNARDSDAVPDPDIQLTRRPLDGQAVPAIPEPGEPAHQYTTVWVELTDDVAATLAQRLDTALDEL